MIPALSPSVAAALLDALPSRLKRRAEKLAAGHETWLIDGSSVTVGEHSVTLTPEPACTCLLSPRCAHVGAVALVAPTASSEPEVPEAEPELQAGISNEERAARLDLAARATQLVEDCLAHGVGGLPVSGHAAALALLQSARVARLPRLERALTAVVGASQSTRAGKPPGRDDLGLRLGSLSLAAHGLARDPEDVGTARRSYSALDGRGTGSFTPVSAEPVLTASGYAGVVIHFLSSKGEFLQLAHTPPGGVANLRAAWHAGVALGDLHRPHAELARHKVLISGGRTSADGRIGRGGGVHAALGAEVELEDLREVPGHRILRGTPQAVTRLGFELEGVPLRFLPAARQTSLGELADWLSTLDEVTVLARNDTALRIWGDGVDVFPGLDRAPDVEKRTPAKGVERPLVARPHGVAEILRHWLGIAAAGGAPALVSQSERLSGDVRRLKNLAAPTAARVLRAFGTRPGAATLAATFGYFAHNRF